MPENTKIKQLFDLGVLSLQNALDAQSNYEDLLIDTARHFDQTANTFKADIEEQEVLFLMFRAATRVACLSLLQYDSIIDNYLLNSPVMSTLAESHNHDAPNVSCGFSAEVNMESFWNLMNQAIRQNVPSVREDLLAYEFQGKNWPSFEKALECSLDNVGMERFWYGCISATLYQQLNVDHPEKITRCIEAMERTLELNRAQPASYTFLGEHRSLFLQATSGVKINVDMFPMRISWLKLLAMHYAYRLQSDFAMLMQQYESNTEQHRYLKDALLKIELASEWTRGISSLSKLRLELLVARAVALRKNFDVYRWTDDLEISASLLRESLESVSATPQQLSAYKQLLADILNDLVVSLPAPSERDPEYFLKSYTIWQEIVKLTDHDLTGQMARRLLGLGIAAERLYDTDAGNLSHLIDASNSLERAARIVNEPVLLAEILFIRARVLGQRRDHPDFADYLQVGLAAFQVVKENPSLLKMPLCPSWCSAHVDHLLGDIRENVLNSDPQVNIQQIYNTIEMIELLISASVEERFIGSFQYSLGSAYELLYRMQTRLGERLEHRMSTLRTALRAAESALKPGSRRYQMRTYHALVASIYDEMSNLSGQGTASQSTYTDLAIEHYRSATNWTGNYIKLTNALEKRYSLHGRRQDLDECVSRLMTQNGGHDTPTNAFYMASQLVRICLDNNLHDKLLPAYKLVFSALRRMSYLGNSSITRYKALSSASASYACDATACALSSNELITAVELLEQGRGCFFAEQLVVQTDTNYVRTFDPVLAQLIEAKLKRVQRFTKDTEAVLDNSISPGSFEDMYRSRVKHDETPSDVRLRLAAHDLAKYLNEVRKLPGYQDPTEPKSFTSLKNAAAHCPIVYVNISQFRCDALILHGSREPPVIVVPLTATWAVRPALITRNPKKLPHICWCPTGPAATFLPLHAAGDYSLGPEHRATSYVVSSYTSTATSLARALEREASTNSNLLLISQPSSPPNMPLPHVNQERDAIVAAMALAKAQVTVLHDEAGRVADVTRLLPTHSILHLACHGKQDKNDPLDSTVLLHDGGLKLREIIGTKLPSAELVYLSACQTAAGDANTPEESLNLAAGFLFAGYRGAVATMWSINDKDGADLAKLFYEHLLRFDGPPATNAALALHCAIQDLIEANPDISLIRWIPFMYFGVTRGQDSG
ncbi:CHAT domain protein [Ceratobasidium sp. AG-Ba]|nr:CHAT domain protein [Ceratobasidium sp. AG-Ba]